MSKAAKINKAIDWITYAAGAYFVGTAIAGAIKKHREEKGTEGIGAAERIKRRIYKEISLAQEAGIDFNKDYSLFSDEEIATLEELGHTASWEQKEQKPYAQAYYESLQKAYNAISGVGIGKAYDIKDANGNPVLTWIEDAAEHVAHERDIEEKRQRTLEAEERAAAARKQRRATERKIQRGQMSLFGVGGDPVYSQKQLERYVTSNRITDVQVDLSDQSKPGRYYVLCGDERGGRGFYLAKTTLRQLRIYCMIQTIPFDFCNGSISGIGAPRTKDLLEPELLEFVRQRVDPRRMSIAFDQIDEMRCPLSMAEPTLYNDIMDLVEEWCINNAIDPDSVWSVVDVEDIFWEL